MLEICLQCYVLRSDFRRLLSNFSLYSKQTNTQIMISFLRNKATILLIAASVAVANADGDFFFNVMRDGVAGEVLISDVANDVTLGKNVYGRRFNVAVGVPEDSLLANVSIGSVVLTSSNAETGEVQSTRSEQLPVCLY